MLEQRYAFVCGCGAVVVAKDGVAAVLSTAICARHVEEAFNFMKKLDDNDKDGQFQLDWLQEIEKGAPLAMTFDVREASEPPDDAA